MKIAWLACAVFLISCGAESDVQAPTETEGQVTPPATDFYVITQPLEGEVLVVGTRQTISWNHEDHLDATVDIRLETPSGVSQLIAVGVTNAGSYLWNVPLLHDSEGSFRLAVTRPGAESPEALEQFERRSLALSAEEASDSVSFKFGSFAALRWDSVSESEQYYWIDSPTGQTRELGTVGDLRTLPWPAPIAADVFNRRVYVIGMNEDGVEKLYILNSHDGTLLADVPLVQGIPSVIITNAAGELLGLRWNMASHEEEVVLIDEDTGEQELIGIVGDLEMWASQAAVDIYNDILYVVGMPNTGEETLYVLESTSGEFLRSLPITMAGTQPVGQVLGLNVNSSGSLIGFRWNPSTRQEEMLQVDTATGLVSVLGTVGDLEWWSTITGLNLTNDNLYVFGQNSASVHKLYVMDARTGVDLDSDRLLYDVEVEDYPMSGLLVY